ncbi:MAG: DUF4124 domain-containing protein [Luteimonas sp.]
MSVRAAQCIVLLAAIGLARAQDNTVIYRCTDAEGALTVQNGTPCPKGSKQDKRVIGTPVVIPAYAPPAKIDPVAAVPATPTATPAPRLDTLPPVAIADADRLPPPPLYQCSTWDNASYLSEDAEPKPRCVRLQTTGLDGDANSGAGEACEMKYDLCSRVPDTAACDGWKQRQREIESTWRYAASDKKRELQDAFARVTQILGATACGK